MGRKVEVFFEVNGRPLSVSVEPRRVLADVLRRDLGLTGTHLGCEHGVCGACTVRLDGQLIRSCLMLAVQCEGNRIETIEGVGYGGNPHPVQRALIEEHGLQCGFCTSGFVVAAVDLLEKNSMPSEEEIRKHLAGNICRCTGYSNIVRAIQRASVYLQEEAER